MKVVTPEISWHGKDAIFSIDVQCVILGQPRRLATAGLDSNVRIWQLKNNEVNFLSNLSRHDKAVNVVRFSKSGLLLASGGDDGTIVIWKLTDKEEIPNIFDTEDGKNVETWCSYKILRGHLEDINDLCWSSDDLYLVTGSVDHNAILWDIEKGQKLAVLSDSNHFVNGVAWDPLGQYIATMSCDRSLRIYNLSTKKLIYCVNKLCQRKDETKAENQMPKSQRIFHDETVVRRRLSFSVDGKMLVCPAGCLQVNGSSQLVNTAMVFSRGNLSKPCAYLPGLKEPTSIVSCCPILFELRERKSTKETAFKLNYRHIFAVASSDTVLFFDTQQLAPFAIVSNIHYASITDLSWASDAAFITVSSRDGFCSIINFEKDELGTRYSPPDNLGKDPALESSLDTKCSLPNKPDGNNIESKTSMKVNLVDHCPNEEAAMETDENVITSSSSKILNVEVKEKETEKSTPVKPVASVPTPRRVLLTPVSNTSSPTSGAFLSSSAERQKSKSSIGKSAPKRLELTTITLK